MHNRPHSEETKKKLSLIFKGKKRLFPMSMETRLKLSIANKGKSGTYGHLGKKHSKESKLRISNNRKGKLLGSDNHSWKGGITKFTQRIRNSIKYRQWVCDVFERDSGCVMFLKETIGRVRTVG